MGVLLYHIRVEKLCVELSHVRNHLYFIMSCSQNWFLSCVASVHLHQLCFLFSLKILPPLGGYISVSPFLSYCYRLLQAPAVGSPN